MSKRWWNIFGLKTTNVVYRYTDSWSRRCISRRKGRLTKGNLIAYSIVWRSVSFKICMHRSRKTYLILTSISSISNVPGIKHWKVLLCKMPMEDVGFSHQIYQNTLFTFQLSCSVTLFILLYIKFLLTCLYHSLNGSSFNIHTRQTIGETGENLVWYGTEKRRNPPHTVE